MDLHSPRAKKLKAAAAASKAPLVTPRLSHDDMVGELSAREREQKEAVQSKQYCRHVQGDNRLKCRRISRLQWAEDLLRSEGILSHCLGSVCYITACYNQSDSCALTLMTGKATAGVAYSWTGVSAYKLQFYCLDFGVINPKDLSLQFANYCNFDNFI